MSTVLNPIPSGGGAPELILDTNSGEITKTAAQWLQLINGYSLIEICISRQASGAMYRMDSIVTAEALADWINSNGDNTSSIYYLYYMSNNIYMRFMGQGSGSIKLYGNAGGSPSTTKIYGIK